MKLTKEQVEHLAVIQATQVNAIPDGSVLVINRRDGRTWIEVVEPEPTHLLAFDMDAS